jgi:DNA (cytosine-5)-methyltransferase 1
MVQLAIEIMSTHIGFWRSCAETLSRSSAVFVYTTLDSQAIIQSDWSTVPQPQRILLRELARPLWVWVSSSVLGLLELFWCRESAPHNSVAKSRRCRWWRAYSAWTTTTGRFQADRARLEFKGFSDIPRHTLEGLQFEHRNHSSSSRSVRDERNTMTGMTLLESAQHTGAGRLSDYSDVPLHQQPVGTFISLYAGAGGLDIGFSLAGFAPHWVSELNANALATNDAAIEALSVSLPHLRNRPYTSIAGDLLALPDSVMPREGSADLVIGGPPCQGFSVAGKMDPSDERSKHVFHFLDVVDLVKPKAFVMENVKALYENRRWASIRAALVQRADELGYDTTMTLANASHFGVPQARERMFFIGVKKMLGSAPALIPTTQDRPPTVREALAQLPQYGKPGNDSLCSAKITIAKAPVLRKSPFAGMLFNGAGRPLNLDAPSITLAASMGGNKTPIIDQNLLDGASESWVNDYHAELWRSEGAVETRHVPPHLRRLTVEEAAAIQTFPIGMDWHGSQSSRFRQIGNAVPPRLAFSAAEAVKKALSL